MYRDYSIIFIVSVYSCYVFNYNNLSTNIQIIQGGSDMSIQKKAFLGVTSAAIAFTPLFASIAPVEASATGEQFKQHAEQSTKETREKLERFKPVTRTDDPNRKVRIVVELKEKSVAQMAVDQRMTYDQLSKSSIQQQENKVMKQQEAVRAKIKSINKDAKIVNEFSTVMNGFSVEVAEKDIDEIERSSNVQAVYEVGEYERPDTRVEMHTSKEIVQAEQVWNDYGYKGEGTIVSVIDSGVDATHMDFTITNTEAVKLKKETVEKAIQDKVVAKGIYSSAKVPFGYNYFDENTDISDHPELSMHGQHVAGTVGANGVLKGVAPETQFLAMKVFSNNAAEATTFGDIYIKAIDDSIKLGADVINMSLGSDGGIVDATNAEQLAIERATKAGIVVAVSAGNSDAYGNGAKDFPMAYLNGLLDLPLASNPEYGVTGAPQVAEHSLGVASIENTHVQSSLIEWTLGGQKQEVPALYANTIMTEGTFELVDAGLGKPEEFPSNMNGKFAIVQRGELAFTEKAINAQAKGAKGIIVYNNEPGMINMAGDENIKIPYLFVSEANGKKMVEGIKKGEKSSVKLSSQTMVTPNENSGKMSSFTSWGSPSNLDFKPEITAPGGQITSTLNNNQYGVMSGTSMAAPHVAGGSAIMAQYVDQTFKVKGMERSKLIKNLLMNTAEPVKYSDNEYVSPRRQGAGVMQIGNAIQSQVVVSDTTTGEGKVAVKQMKDSTFTLQLKAKNYSKEEKTFAVKERLQVDNAMNINTEEEPVYALAPNKQLNDQGGQKTLKRGKDYQYKGPKLVTIPAGKEKTFELTFDVSKASKELLTVFENGFYVDGFVELEDQIKKHPKLVVPFFGFEGDWTKAPIFDGNEYDDNISYWGYSLLWAKDAKGKNTPVVADSNEQVGVNFSGASENGVAPSISLLRTAKDFKISVVDSQKKELKVLTKRDTVRKHGKFNEQTGVMPFTTYNAWDGTIDGKPAQEGQYYIKLEARVDDAKAKVQQVYYPVKVDRTAPTATVAYEESNHMLSVHNLKDNYGGVGVSHFIVEVDGVALAKENEEGQLETQEFAADVKIVDLTNQPVKEDSVIKVTLYDFAGNVSEQTVDLTQVQVNRPAISFNMPENLDSNNTDGTFDVFAPIYPSNLKEVKLNGKVVKTFELELEINGKEKREYGVVDSEVTFKEEGYHVIQVEATDQQGQVGQASVRVFYDKTSPELSILSYDKVVQGSTAKVKVNIKDNFEGVSILANDEPVYAQKMDTYEMVGSDEDVVIELPLRHAGENTFKIVAEDIAGNTTEQTIVITKDEKGAGSFTDLDNVFSKKQINELASRGIIGGKGNGLFKPNDSITREEFTALIVRSLNLPTSSVKGTFKDVDKKSMFATQIEAAHAAGIISGVTPTTFNGKASIRREEMAAIIVRAAKYQDDSILKGFKQPKLFADDSKIHPSLKENVYEAASLGIVVGYQNQFNPKGSAKRSEAAAMLYRLLDQVNLLN